MSSTNQSACKSDFYSSPFDKLESQLGPLLQKANYESRSMPSPDQRFIQQICRTPFLSTSTKKLNLLARMIQRKTLQEAMLQMMFSKKRHAREVLWALQAGANIARDEQGANVDLLKIGK